MKILRVIAFIACFGFAFSPWKQTSIEIISHNLDYVFNSHLSFTVEFQTEAVIQEAFVFYQFAGSQHEWVYEGSVEGNNLLAVEVQFTAENQPALFGDVEYWFRFATDHGVIIETDHFIFVYDDNRYSWMTVQDGPFSLHWHNGDSSFAASILAAARQGVQRTQLLLPLADPADVTLRVYDATEDVQLIAQRSGFAWQAGHTDPDADMLLFSLAPGQSLEVQRQVPHEIAHLMLYQALGEQVYNWLPVWLTEGIASYAEVYSDPTRAGLLQIASDTNTLIPLYSLCSAFPQDAASARLAYAESASFIDFLAERYNPTGFALLFNAYAISGDCLNAPVDIFGKDLIALEADWRTASFAKDDSILAWLAAFPWQPIVGSAAVAAVLFLLLKRVGYSKK